MGQGHNGEQILKFRDSEEPVRFTETDDSVHDIRRVMSRIEKDMTFLERKVEKSEKTRPRHISDSRQQTVMKAGECKRTSIKMATGNKIEHFTKQRHCITCIRKFEMNNKYRSLLAFA
ncbi:hypothetical protein KIN20_023268 [Parelaphostrongylus tenuis]|uniref:Uncharacterized protein n=1 Tax=Parelaphostrongylus tenuis TaxID=148309 RepID=A0AAD5MRR9_PARTN|nr:hypothetical protein KIN20_023268 [Parelaphostrongylus tenuis]